MQEAQPQEHLAADGREIWIFLSLSFPFFSLITIFIFFFLYVFCFCDITLSLHCIFSLYTVLVLFSSFSLPFLSFLLQVLVLSTFTRSYHHFYLFSFLFFLFLSSYLFGPLCLLVFFFLLSYCCNFFVYPLLVRSWVIMKRLSLAMDLKLREKQRGFRRGRVI